ncbi:transcriptional regulator [candidate division TA06 bacterium]|uniref:Transcriptional regulator n=1 Tax=candidate division TA06 bacterium TaxID=2250710 RepID=A0A660SAN2_UNCT6|nr:MAG: transcriptional regulator [candidate division TA06 bacterium]
MKVDLLDLRREYNSIKNEIDEVVFNVISSGRFILGPEVEAFEKELEKHLSVKHAIGVGNGTDALSLALAALDVKDGDEIITTPFTFIATAEVIALKGAIPVFADIDMETGNMLPAEIEKKINNKTKGIIAVHLFGQPCDIDRIKEIARRNNLFLIEDTAQAIGAKYNGKAAGTWGDIGTISFFPTKNLGAYGDGGAVITNNDEIAEKIRQLRVHGSDKKYHHVSIGFNSRLDAIQAAILRVKLKHLEEWTRKRQEIASIYSSRIKTVKVPFTAENREHIFHQYTLKSRRRDAFREYLKDNGIASAIHYPIPLHLQPAFSYLNMKKGSFPIAEKLANEVLSIPVHPFLTNDEIEYIISVINKWKE